MDDIRNVKYAWKKLLTYETLGVKKKKGKD